MTINAMNPLLSPSVFAPTEKINGLAKTIARIFFRKLQKKSDHGFILFGLHPIDVNRATYGKYPAGGSLT
jgi:hypothetical protein